LTVVAESKGRGSRKEGRKEGRIEGRKRRHSRKPGKQKVSRMEGGT
jgi:hypothetical protein